MKSKTDRILKEYRSDAEGQGFENANENIVEYLLNRIEELEDKLREED